MSNFILYKRNVKKGDTWNVKTFGANEDGCDEAWDVEYYCITSDTIISTHNRDFRCKGYGYKIMVPSSWGYNYINFEKYFSEGIGLVKRVQSYNTTPTFCLAKYEYILKDYYLK